MRKIQDYNFKDKKVLIRVDFNVPLDENRNITDFTRIDAAIPTIQKVLNDGGSAILMSHMGRPKNGYEESSSLMHILDPLTQKLNLNTVKFSLDCIGPKAHMLVNKLNPGEVLLLENLRFHQEEKQGDKFFAELLSELADVYINDAFGTAHRAHASTCIIADYFEDKFAGYVIQAELENADKVLLNSEKPFTAIMGGAKISDKILIIDKLLDKVDNILIGGGMAYTFFKAKGGNIGKSLVEEDKIPLAKTLIEKAKEKRVNLVLPIDSLVANDFNNEAETQTVGNMDIPSDFMGLDIGREAQTAFAEIIENSKTILWNGPMGVFEMPNFANGTINVAKAVVKATENGAYSLIGGGDSAAAINNLGFGDKVSYVSTGGGALLEYMEGKELPGIVALNQ